MADFKWYKDVYKGKFPEVGIVADAAFPVCYAQKGGYDGIFTIPAGGDLVSFNAGNVRNSIPDTAELVVKGSYEEIAKVLENVPNVTVSADGDHVVLTGKGKAGHAAFPIPGEKNNAIVNAAAAGVILEEKLKLDLGGIRLLSEGFENAFGEGLGINFSDEESGSLTVNAGVIRTEGRSLLLDIDIRYPVTAKAEDITKKLRENAEKYGASFEIGEIASPYYIDPKDPKVTAMLDAYREVTGDTVSQPYSMGGGTYSRVVPNGISFGPGFFGGKRPDFLPAGHGSAHGPDETLNIENWLKGFKVYILSVIKLDSVL